MVVLCVVCCVVCCVGVVCCVVCCVGVVCCVVCCVLCGCFTVSLFFNACDVTTKLAPDAPPPRRNKKKLTTLNHNASTCSTTTSPLFIGSAEQWACLLHKRRPAQNGTSVPPCPIHTCNPRCCLGLISHNVKSSNIPFHMLGCSEPSSSLPSLEYEVHILHYGV